ncbi:MAG: hypothetical protein NZ934_00625 [Hadesarchaea archaeon]|nr:hypothetical protein [Hadesarchaea archaeon]
MPNERRWCPTCGRETPAIKVGGTHWCAICYARCAKRSVMPELQEDLPPRCPRCNLASIFIVGNRFGCERCGYSGHKDEVLGKLRSEVDISRVEGGEPPTLNSARI